MPFDPVNPRQNFPELERGIQAYWAAEDVFHRSITMRENGEIFSFYDGPPFATGLPHYGHILAGTIKDVIPRFQTMRGKRVDRRFGWDCHGLPVEYEIEKEQGIQSRADIDALGVARFNELCRGIVQRYVAEWRSTVERMGRFVDMDKDYRTMDPDYMESIWWVFGELEKKGLLKEGYKPMHVCPRCVTPLSNFEVTQGYRDVDDLAATVAFRSTDDPDTFFLAWTTTPWTLPGNLFLAVHPDISYTKVVHNGKTYILAEPLLERIFNDIPFKKIGTPMKGSALVGQTYEPLFPFFGPQYPTAFRIVAGDFVTTNDGTGIVHIAPGFGEDDEAIGRREGVLILQHVSMNGQFIPAVTDFAGMDVKPKDAPNRTDKAITAWLKERGLLFRTESYRHSYPHCWRCESPLLNYATSSWFVAVENIKDAMLAANATTQWVPEHVRDGRFGKWLEGARDWAISRNRYWGTPLPVWRTDDKNETVIFRSRDDLRRYKPVRFTKITTVRHGESLSNTQMIFNGIAPGVPLTERGREQAGEAAAYLKDQAVDIIYASPMRRAQETAAAIAKATGATIITDERLTETSFGPHEGKAHDEQDLSARKARRMAKLETRDVEPFYYLEGMETHAEMTARMRSFLLETLPRHRSEHIVIVSHGSPLMRLRGLFTNEDPYKLSVLRLPGFAEPIAYYWDHDREAQADLHKHIVDTLQWPAKSSNDGVCLTVVRHGETEWNRERRMQGGESDIPLNDTGRAQAIAAAASLKGQTFDAVVCSPMLRATETAAIMAEKLGISDVITLEGLRERRVGIWSGQPAHDLERTHPTLPAGTCISMFPTTPDGGESLSAFLRRIEGTCEELLQKFAGKKVLVVCHRGSSAALRGIAQNTSYRDMSTIHLKNAEAWEISLHPFLKRIPEVLDCWFESGSMPYAQERFPYRFNSNSALKIGKKSVPVPVGFPADFIAEGTDQTRGWFYTLTVLGAALYGVSPFKHCIVNGIVLAEDGRKMSKRLKNYPEPATVLEKHGADALRFALMHSPAVHAEDFRFSEKTVEEAVRSVILPLWNSYSFFVTYASLANYEPTPLLSHSTHPLDAWLRAELQDLTNRVTTALESYDLAAAAGMIHDALDSLTNWYIRLSRKRFAGKGPSDAPEATSDQFSQDQRGALDTLYESLLVIVRLLAPFCPFITDAIYINLTSDAHGSVHLTDWPEEKKLTKAQVQLLQTTRVLRTIVSLGMTVRSDTKTKVRLPLRSATIAVPSTMLDHRMLRSEDRDLLMQELNVKEIHFTDDPGSLGERTVSVNARMVGPRLGQNVQAIIAAGKRGEFTELPDGTIKILGEILTAEEAPLHYKGGDGHGVAAQGGVIVSLDTAVDDALILEGNARELIRFIQQQRKNAGLSLHDRIVLQIDGAEDVLAAHGPFITQQTNAEFGPVSGEAHVLDLDDHTYHMSFRPVS